MVVVSLTDCSHVEVNMQVSEQMSPNNFRAVTYSYHIITQRHNDKRGSSTSTLACQKPCGMVPAYMAFLVATVSKAM